MLHIVTKKENTIVMSIRGTDLTRLEENDILTDALLAFGQEKCRNCYKNTYTNLLEIHKAYPTYKIILTGHSLGGRIAVDLLDSDLGKYVDEVHVFNCATAPAHLYPSRPCFMDTIPKNKINFCENRDKLHIHLVNNDPISILSIGDKSKTKKVYKRKLHSSNVLKGYNTKIKTNHSNLNFV